MTLPVNAIAEEGLLLCWRTSSQVVTNNLDEFAGLSRAAPALHLPTVFGIGHERRVPGVWGHLSDGEIPRLHRARQGAALRKEKGHPAVRDEGDEADAGDEARQYQQVDQRALLCLFVGWVPAATLLLLLSVSSARASNPTASCS